MKDELINHLRTFISFKTVQNNPGAKHECLDWIQSGFLRKAPHAAKRGEFEGSPWLYLPAENSTLLVFAHCDVVPAPEAMFTLKVSEDKAMGRGTSDMKGNILPLLMAYRDALSKGRNPNISILLTTDEEVAGKSIPYLLDEGILTATAAYTPDADDGGIVCEHKGVIWAELVATGSGGHGAYPWNTENPVWLLAKALEALRIAFPPGTGADWQTTVSPTTLRASEARNQVSDTASCGLDIRFPPEAFATPEDALQAVSEMLPPKCEVRSLVSSSALHTPQDHPAVLAFTKHAEAVLGRDIPIKREHGGTDARYFGERGIPAFLYGPKGGGLHSNNEWVSISSLLDHYKLYCSLLR